MSIKRVFVSDVHMSPGLSFGSLKGRYDWFSKDESLKFGQFLAYLIGDDSIQEVIFLGDIMDDWVYPIEIQPPKYDDIANTSHIVNIMTNLRTLAQRKKGNVTYETHCLVQDFFFGEDLMLRRHDYHVNIAGGFAAAQLISDYMEVSGIRLPTKRRAYTRGPDRRPILEMLMVSIDISDVSFA